MEKIRELMGAKNQTEFIVMGLKAIFRGQYFPPYDSRTGNPPDGWSVIRDAGLTRAIKAAGLPWIKTRSGSKRTSGTQIPTSVLWYADKLKGVWRMWERGDYEELLRRLLIV